MIDTIKIVIPYNEEMITKPERFGGVDQIWQMECCFITGNARLDYPNLPTNEEKELGYFPRLQLSRTAYPIKGIYMNLYVECSLPKLLYGNNVEELRNEDFPDVITALQTKLEIMGVSVSQETIENAYVQRVDYAKNFRIQGSPKMFIYYMEKIDIDPRLGNFDRDYQNGGTGLKFHTKEYQVMVYDKMAEIEKSLRYSDSRSLTGDNACQEGVIRTLQANNIKIIRYEVSLKRNKIKEITLPAYTFRHVFNADVAKGVLSRYITRLHAGMRSLNLDNTETIAVMNRIKQAFPSATGKRLANIEAMMRYVNQYGYDFLRNELGMSSSAISKVRSEIRAINAIPSDTCRSGVMADMLAIEQSLERFGAMRFSRQTTN